MDREFHFEVYSKLTVENGWNQLIKEEKEMCKDALLQFPEREFPQFVKGRDSVCATILE